MTMRKDADYNADLLTRYHVLSGMNMIRTDIKKIIEKTARKKYGIQATPPFSVRVSEESAYGDYSTNAAFLLAKLVKKPPADCAQEIAEELKKEALFKKVEAVNSGFLNFFISDAALHQELNSISKKKERYGISHALHPKLHINTEFISANPTGPLTLGNGRGAFIGDVLANVLSRAGHHVTREYYINDARASTQIQELGKTIAEKGKAYRGSYTDEIRERLKNRFADIQKISFEDLGFAAAQEIQKDNKKFITQKLKIRFDAWYSEEKLYKDRKILRVLDMLNKNGATYEKDGAVWFRSTAFGDSEDRVALRKGGAPTYFLPDVAYHREKLDEREFDVIIDILGADHHGTFPRVRAGLQALGINPERVTPLFMQIVRWKKGGKEVKMSKRKGMFVTLEELIDDVGLDAARYFFLEKSPDTHMDFDSERAKEQSVKNPVYYIQYAHARITSIFRKASVRRPEGGARRISTTLLHEPEELVLIKKLIQFPEIIEDTAHDYHVHRIPRYAYELARDFHAFYEKHRVITDDQKLTEARLALAKAAKIVLSTTLAILCISAPKKM